MNSEGLIYLYPQLHILIFITFCGQQPPSGQCPFVETAACKGHHFNSASFIYVLMQMLMPQDFDRDAL